MPKLEDTLAEIKKIAANPKARLQAYLAQGKKVVGCFPMYTPEVLAHAAGMIPMGMWGAQTELMRAKSYLPAFACPIMQSCLELGLRGTYKGVSAVMIPTMCDTFRCITQNWRAGVQEIPMIAYTFPQNRVMEAAVEFFVSELEGVRKQLEDIAGRKITDADIDASIKVYNAHSALIREFADVANDHLDVITPRVRHAVMKSAMFVDKAEHSELLKNLIAALKERPAHDWKGKRVVLTGITAEPEEFLAIFEDNKLAVVGDDLGQEMRQYRTDVPGGNEPPIVRLSRQWQNRIGDPLANADKKQRIDLLFDLVKKGKAEGVVVCLMKFCDPEEYDFPMYKKPLTEAGIGVVSIDMDQQPAQYDQARTRLQTFAEML